MPCPALPRPVKSITPDAYHGLVQQGTLQPASWRVPVLHPLLPRRLRMPATALLAACVATPVVLAVRFVGHGQPGSLDNAIDTQVYHWDPSVLRNELFQLATLKPVALMTIALAVACLATRRWSGAILAAAAAPLATGLTEYILKPYVGGPLDAAFPSGRATSMFALAATCAVLLADPPRRRVGWAARPLLVLMALALAIAVTVATVAIGAHTFTEVVAGAAVGIGFVLAGALLLDLVVSPAVENIIRRPE